MFLLDLEQGKIVDDEEVKRQVARRRPYGDWYQEAAVHIDDLPEREPLTPRIEPLRSKQLAFGYSQEDLKLVIAPMAAKAEEPIASMGNDIVAGGALGPPAAAVRLLQAAVRAGHEPTDRPDP